MAVKNLTDTQKKLNLIEKLINGGFTSEKQIQDMTIEKMLTIGNLKIEDIKLITELQKAIKNHNIIGFLSVGVNDEQ